MRGIEGQREREKERVQERKGDWNRKGENERNGKGEKERDSEKRSVCERERERARERGGERKRRGREREEGGECPCARAADQRAPLSPGGQPVSLCRGLLPCLAETISYSNATIRPPSCGGLFMAAAPGSLGQDADLIAQAKERERGAK